MSRNFNCHMVIWSDFSASPFIDTISVYFHRRLIAVYFLKLISFCTQYVRIAITPCCLFCQTICP